MPSSPLREKSAGFAKDIVFTVRDLREKHVESILLNQLLRCGTSVGANIHEAQFAQGSRDFISKLEIALKECNECDYWLNLLKDTECISQEAYQRLISSCRRPVPAGFPEPGAGFVFHVFFRISVY